MIISEKFLFLTILSFLQPLNSYNRRALVKSSTSFMFESLMLYFLLGMRLFITLPKWWIRCWIKVKAIHKNITNEWPHDVSLFRNTTVSLDHYVPFFACKRVCLHTVIHLTSIKLNSVSPCWRRLCYLLVFSLLMKTNIVMMVFCQHWGDDFSNLQCHTRVLKLSSAKYPDILQAVFLQQSPQLF